MAWTFTTPVQAGDLDPVGSYAQIDLKLFEWTEDGIRMRWEYGNTVDEDWVPGITPMGKVDFCFIEGTDYVALCTTHMSNDGELTYDAVRRGAYEYLVSEGLIDAGTMT